MDDVGPVSGAARNETTRRCIWLTMDEALDRNLAEAYFAAPANPVEAVRTEVEAAFGVSTWSDAVIFGALRALGWRAS